MATAHDLLDFAGRHTVSCAARAKVWHKASEGRDLACQAGITGPNDAMVGSHRGPAVMPLSLQPVRPITLAEIEQARRRIAPTIVRTPLVRLELGPGFPDIRLKLENLQP